MHIYIYIYICIVKQTHIHKQIFIHPHTDNNYMSLDLYITLLNWLLTVQICGYERCVIIASFREYYQDEEGAITL